MIITRLSAPTKLDTVPKGTLCKVVIKSHEFKDGESIGSDKFLVYKQISDEENNPVWEQIE